MKKKDTHKKNFLFFSLFSFYLYCSNSFIKYEEIKLICVAYCKKRKKVIFIFQSQILFNGKNLQLCNGCFLWFYILLIIWKQKKNYRKSHLIMSQIFLIKLMVTLFFFWKKNNNIDMYLTIHLHRCFHHIIQTTVYLIHFFRFCRIKFLSIFLRQQSNRLSIGETYKTCNKDH